tara:strand:+ start:520 stop:645 length:126 start_codon:yes stop_codon:yes gene_type:complete
MLEGRKIDTGAIRSTRRATVGGIGFSCFAANGFVFVVPFQN